MHDKTLDTLLGVVGIALILGSVSMVSQSKVKIVVSKPYSQAQVAGAGTNPFDVNGDGRIDNRDVEYVGRIMGGVSGQVLTHGQLDYNNNGTVSANDGSDLRLNAPRWQIACPAQKICDVDRNGRVTTDDASRLINYFGNTASRLMGQLDYNNDGKADRRDTEILKNIIAQDAACPSFRVDGLNPAKICDLSGDGDIFGNDLVIFTNYIGSDRAVDFNRDNRADLADLSAIRSHMFSTRGDGFIYFDLNLDGKTDNKDVKNIIATKNSRVYKPLFDIAKRDSSRRLVAGSDGLIDRDDLLFMRTNLPVRVYYDLDISGITSIKDVQLVIEKLGAGDEYFDVIGSDGRVTVQDIKGIGRALLDLNRDGKVTIDDIHAFCIEGKNCDFNEDGKMNEDDNRALKVYLVGRYASYVDAK